MARHAALWADAVVSSPRHLLPSLFAIPYLLPSFNIKPNFLLQNLYQLTCDMQIEFEAWYKIHVANWALQIADLQRDFCTKPQTQFACRMSADRDSVVLVAIGDSQ